MARKTPGTTTRGKKNASTTETPAVQPAPLEVVPDLRNKVTPITAAVKKTNLDLDEEIRRRAYELYLERNGAPGDPAMDWLTAEREVRSRYASQAALAASQGRS